MSGTGNYYAPYGANLYSTPMNNNPAYGMQMQNNTNSVITVPVTNETEVQNYLVGAGNTVIFVDFDHGKLWIKSTAANGVPMQMRKFKLSEEMQEPVNVNASAPTEQYATKADFDELKKMVEELLK